MVNYLRKIRELRKMSEGDLAIVIGVSRPCINMISNGHRLPSLPVALRIAEALGVDVGDIWEFKKSNSRS